MPVCSVEGCEKPVIARDLCTKHYQRFKKYGDPLQTHRNEGAICSVEGCGKVAKSRGLCRAHYWRLRHHGDPLAGRTAEGEPWRFLNEMDLNHLDNACLRWPYGHNGVGYPMIWLDGKYHLATRIVCERIHGPAPTPEHEAAHTCGKGHLGCVSPRHLQWETPRENQMDRVMHDTHQRGERHPLVKITEDDARYIREMKGKVTQWQLAEQFGISRTQVSRIQNGKRWAWLD